MAVPMLGQTAQVYSVASLAVSFWVNLAVPLAMLGLVSVTAFAIARRAGRMSAVQAIAAGCAPQAAHGYRAHRLLGRTRQLPRPVTIGMAGPFARPARTLVTLAAIVFGGTAVIFAAGLRTSLDRVQADLSRAASKQVQVFLAGHQGLVVINGHGSVKLSLAAQERAVQAALRAQPGTLHYVAQASNQISVLGLSGQLSLIGFGGDARWTGYAIIAGHWYSGPGQVDVNTAFLHDTGTAVGDKYTLTSGASTPRSRSPVRSSTPRAAPRR